jgi:DNA repair exonuclease SbcCD ATPase subunit
MENETESESKFKRTLLQTEKRIMDLEVSVSELTEKLKKIDPKEFSAIKERTEELEDLVTVEQAGIIELKKMLEEFQKKVSAEPVEEKLAESTEYLKGEIENIKNKLKGFSEEMANIKSGFGGTLDNIEKRISEIEIASHNLEEKIKDIDVISNELIKIKSKTLENVNETNARFLRIENKMKDDYEFFLKENSELKSRLEEKIKEAVVIREEAKAIFSSLSEKIDNRVNEIENFMQNLISVATGRTPVPPKIETTQINERISKIEEGVKNKFSELEENYKKKLEEIASIVEKRIIQTRAPIGAITAQIDELIDRIINLESKLAALEKITKEKKEPIVLE